MDKAFDPYHKWLGIPPAEQPPNHYRLLGIPLFENDRDVIESAIDQRVLHLRTFQLGKQSAWAEKLLGEVVAAQICLLNGTKKSEYDEQLRGKQQKVAETSDLVVSVDDAMPEADVHDMPKKRRAKQLIAAGVVAAVVCVVLLVLGISTGNSPTHDKVVPLEQPRKRMASPVDVETSPAKPVTTQTDKKSKTSVLKSDSSAQKTDGKSVPGDEEKPSVVLGDKDKTKSAPIFDRWPFEAVEAKIRQMKTSKAIYQPVDFTNSVGIKFKLIPAGEFIMGSPETEVMRNNGGEESLHKVRITKPYYISICEITQEQYEAVLGNNPSRFKESTRPVENVSWNDAVEFCKKLSEKDNRTYRLPTETEWEYACRAGTTTPFAFGRTLSSKATANFRGVDIYNTHTRGPYHNATSLAGAYPPNAWGLHDMHGNVKEWCMDWQGDYPADIIDDPTGPSTGVNRVIRGGSWFDKASGCRSACRSGRLPELRSNAVGFRVVLVPSKEVRD